MSNLTKLLTTLVKEHELKIIEAIAKEFADDLNQSEDEVKQRVEQAISTVIVGPIKKSKATESASTFTGYSLYAKEKRQEIVKNATTDEEKNIKHISATVSASWKELSEEKRAEYRNRAAEYQKDAKQCIFTRAGQRCRKIFCCSDSDFCSQHRKTKQALEHVSQTPQHSVNECKYMTKKGQCKIRIRDLGQKYCSKHRKLAERKECPFKEKNGKICGVLIRDSNEEFCSKHRAAKTRLVQRTCIYENADGSVCGIKIRGENHKYCSKHRPPPQSTKSDEE